MPLSFKSRLAKLEHKGQISKEEYQDLLTKLDGHDRQIRADAIEEYLRLFCNKDNQMNFVKLNHHSWTSYAKHIAEQLKEQM